MNGKNLAQSVWSVQGAGWFLAGVAGLVGIWLTLHWFSRFYAANLGWLGLTTLIVAGGIVTHLYRRRKVKLTVCSTKSQIRPLQVSCLAVQALGVQWIWYAESPYFWAGWPFLTWSGWPYLFIISGVAGLGWLSLWCDCRDEAFLG